MPDLLFLYSNSIDWMEWSEALPSLEELNLSLTHGRLAGLWWCSRISFWALTTRRAPLPPSAVCRTIIQYKALSRLQQAESSPRQPLIQPPTTSTPPPLLNRLQCTVGLDNQIPDAISGAFRGRGFSSILACSIVPLCSCCWQIGVSSDLLR